MCAHLNYSRLARFRQTRSWPSADSLRGLWVDYRAYSVARIVMALFPFGTSDESTGEVARGAHMEEHLCEALG
jgi:hypothetical protein